MKEEIKGVRYNYIVALNKEGKDFCFQIFSLHKESQRKSSITNLNWILSEIISSIIDIEKVEDSWVYLNKEKCEKLFDVALANFNNKAWINYLEAELDEDRVNGGWNSNVQF